jgi:hypothetical protein
MVSNSPSELCWATGGRPPSTRHLPGQAENGGNRGTRFVSERREVPAKSEFSPDGGGLGSYAG